MAEDQSVRFLASSGSTGRTGFLESGFIPSLCIDRHSSTSYKIFSPPDPQSSSGHTTVVRNLHVSLHVQCQVVRTGEGPVTQVTLKGTMPSMFPIMAGQFI